MKYDATITNKGAVIHILIIWSKAMKYKDFIIDDMSKNFELLKIFRGHWDRNLFLQNYSIFYAHSQYERDYFSYKSILKSKIKICGADDFEIIVFRDNNPQFENRQTSNGVRIVNKRAFDKKTEYRELAKGGHRIHGSDDAWETNKDLTILFGMNTEDFCSYYGITDDKSTTRHDLSEDLMLHNCIGVNGYNSINEFFYVLNNTINYVVLRNHEVIPDSYTVEGHGDIDLLVENKRYAAYLTAASPVYRQSYRSYYMIKIGGEVIPFDFREVDDNYYDSGWEQDILKNRVLKKKIFYTPDPINQFYSLLYHAFIQKPYVKDDYNLKLSHYGNAVGVNYAQDPTYAIALLDHFMQKMNYEYIKPQDLSVYYNIKNISLSSHALIHGKCIKRLNSLSNDKTAFHSVVFEKPNSFVKKGTEWLINNEASFLCKIGETAFTPSLMNKNASINSDDIVIEISRIPGESLDVLLDKCLFYNIKNLKAFVKQSLDILFLLEEKKVAHRDFSPSNILFDIKSQKVGVIDFGWATDIEKICKNRPEGLGHPYVKSPSDTDAQMFANVLRKHFRGYPYFKNIERILHTMTIDVYKDQASLSKKKADLQKIVNRHFDIISYFVLLLYKFKIIAIVKLIKKDPKCFRLYSCYWIKVLPKRVYEYVQAKITN